MPLISLRLATQLVVGVGAIWALYPLLSRDAPPRSPPPTSTPPRSPEPGPRKIPRREEIDDRVEEKTSPGLHPKQKQQEPGPPSYIPPNFEELGRPVTPLPKTENVIQHERNLRPKRSTSLEPRVDQVAVQGPSVVKERPGTRLREEADEKDKEARQISDLADTETDRRERSRLIEQAKGLRMQKKTLNDQAATEIFNYHNPSYDSNLLTCDLHWLRVTEAEQRVTSHIKRCIAENVSETEIITGKGSHNEDGVSRLKPAVKKYLDSLETVTILHEREGAFRIKVA